MSFTTEGPSLLTPRGADSTELEEAVALLCVRYGACIAFDVEAAQDFRSEFITRMAGRKVRVRFRDPDAHEWDVAQKASLPATSMMICARFGQ